jgi:hypothetical protein
MSLRFLLFAGVVLALIQVAGLNAQTCDYLPGDINGNGHANGVDILFAVAYLGGDNTPPDTCDCRPAVPVYPFYAAGDVNGNCAFNGIDVTYFVAYLKGTQPSLRYCQSCPPGPISGPILNAKSDRTMK